MRTRNSQRSYRAGAHRRWLHAVVAIALAAMSPGPVRAHIVPPEKLHPVAESYRRMGFLLQLNPILWPQVESETAVIAEGLAAVSAEEAARYREAVAGRFSAVTAAAGDNGEALDPEVPLGGDRGGKHSRKATAQEVFSLSTQAVARTLRHRLELARSGLGDHASATRQLQEARQLWSSFEPAVAAADPQAFRRLGESWLELRSALGSPGLFGVGAVAPNGDAFAEDTESMVAYLEANFGDGLQLPRAASLAPIPASSPAGSPAADHPAQPSAVEAEKHRALRGGSGETHRRPIPPRLPPGSDINKQLPRPRQVLNMVTRGVDETETTLIALGDMVFDSYAIFGEPARSLGISCNTCHNKSITNPGFFIPGLSSRPGNIDVSNSFFAPHANNGRFDPIDIPDLRGIRFTSPYGRNGRFESLREFVRNVIVNEFNGPEPDPVLLDGLIAYMLEFDFLPNSHLGPDGRLNGGSTASARRGEEIFHRPFEQMGGRACATCHVPSDHFLDRKRHDIGTVDGSEPGSRDRALDTPTLLSARYTAPYFHDGSQPTLRAVNEWFDERFELGLSADELADLTAYVETVSDGVDPYEDTVHTLDAELEEFSFFLSAYEFLRDRGKSELMDITFETVAFEIRAHKWDVQDSRYLPVLDRLARLMDEAQAARRRGDLAAVDRSVAAYRALYRENVEVLR